MVEVLNWCHYNWIRILRQVCCMCLLNLLLQLIIVSADTNSNDAAALTSLSRGWQNTPTNWVGVDPCGGNWVGISCNDSRVTSINLVSLGLVGTLTGDIQSFSELQNLDLSYNEGLTGELPASIGSLSKLKNLVLVGCSFSGQLPHELGSLLNLTFLSLNSNNFTGSIPATIGYLSRLYWLDLADNQLTGTIPVSNGQTPGLDLLTNTKHFHFGLNQLSGTIPSQLFSSNMKLIHVVFDNNNLMGSIPPTLGLVKTLEVVRFDRNSLSGIVPANINNLTNVAVLQLSNNRFSGPLPNLTGMSTLSFVDMSNNSFDPSDAPTWFTSLPSLTTLYLENLRIGGQVPAGLFSSSQLQTVNLRHNKFNGTLNIASGFSSQLQLVDIRDNSIGQLTLGRQFPPNLLRLEGNPVCAESGSSFSSCKDSVPTLPPYSTPSNCVSIACLSDQNLSPKCNCAYPYVGTLYFRAPFFSALSNTTYYHILEVALDSSFQKNNLPVDAVSLQNPLTDSKEYLTMTLEVFPAGKIRFDQSDISNIGFVLSNQTFKPPKTFGPFTFSAEQYNFSPVTSFGSNNSNATVIIGAAVGGALLVLILGVLAYFCIQRKKKRETVGEQSQPFDSWQPTEAIGTAPQLKGARWFSFEEMKKCTNNFSEANDIGGGGYGKVYRGILANGQSIAVKRSEHGSMQGGLEFKTEIELLSRVHHKNLLSLVGYCFDQGEQMLVYEYITNGSLKDSLSGKSGIHLDWQRRLKIALGAARGLAYMHEHANPPIIHRDVKSTNILLDDTLNAKVSDFGLSKPMVDVDKTHVTTQVKGTMGYLDPEYYMSQRLTEKSDVYSFGVVLLELLTAKRPLERGHYIVREVKIKMDKTKDLYGLHELLDPIIGVGPTLVGFEKFVDLAVKCVAELGVDRPTMSEVVKEIENIMHFAGMNPNADSAASSSVSYEGASKGALYHPYGHESESESVFDYSSGTLPQAKVEPKGGTCKKNQGPVHGPGGTTGKGRCTARRVIGLDRGGRILTLVFLLGAGVSLFVFWGLYFGVMYFGIFCM